MTAMWPTARMAAGFSSCTTITQEVKDMISKKMNAVIRSAARNTPAVAPSVSSVKNQ